jgi:hypothetical protein
MKLKYKKIILLTTMSTMGIGLLTLSISHDRPKAEDSLNPTAIEASLLSDGTDLAKTLGAETMDAIATPLPTSAPTPSPEPTPLPVYDIEKDAYPEIQKLFVNYYAAKNSCDVGKLESILSDPTKVETLDQLKSKTEYIEDYRNIKAYTKKSAQEGTYIVYVYHEIKFTGVNTPAPGLAKFYLLTDNDGNLKIFSGEMDPSIKGYYDARNDDKDVQNLIEMTNEKSEKAKDKDEDLANFWNDIDKMATKANDTAQGDAAE